MKRRTFIGTSAVASIGMMAPKTANAMRESGNKTVKLKNNINHSVCRWCYKDIPMEDFLKNLNDLGIKAMDLTGPEDWPLMKKYNIHSSMCWGRRFRNRKRLERHQIARRTHRRLQSNDSEGRRGGLYKSYLL